MDIEKAIKEIKELIDMYGSRHDREDFSIISNLTKKQKAELKKKDTVIDLMADKLVEAHGWFYSEFDNYTKEDFKQYFYKKASDEKC